MSVALQVALFLASLAIIVLTACLIPLAFLAWRQLAQLARSAEQLKAEVQALVQSSHELVQNVNALSKRAGRQMDEVDQVVRTVRQWAERADRLVNQVGAVIEPPVLSLARHANLFRTGAAAFVQALLHPRRKDPADPQPSQPTKESDNVE